MSTAQTLDVKNVAIALLVPSPTEAQKQRRAHFDKAALQQLAENIAGVGLVNPILVRPLGEKFEIVAGERRYQAAKIAKLEHVPVSVRELSDDQVLELQLIENLQREGLHELHEAEGYEALRKRGMSAPEIADKVGKSKEYVFARMKLLALSPASRKAFYDGKMNASIALLIARIPVEKLQAEALKEVTEGRWGSGPMSYRQAAEHIQNNYMTRLDQAPFDTADAKLLPSAKACGSCEKNTLTQKELFGDVKGGSAGVCTDPVCFKSKVTAHNEAVIEKAKKEGKKVISGKAAKEIFPWEHSPESLGHNTGYVTPSAKNYSDPKQRTYRELAGKDAPTVTVINPWTSEVVQLIAHDEVKAGMKRQGIKLVADSGGRAKSPKQAAADKKSAEKEKLELAVRREVATQLMERAPKPLHRDELAQIYDHIMCHNNTVDEVLGDLSKVSTKKATEPQMLKIVRAHLYGELLEDTYDDAKLMFETAKRAGINVDQVRKQVAAELAKPDAEKKSTSKKK